MSNPTRNFLFRTSGEHILEALLASTQRICRGKADQLQTPRSRFKIIARLSEGVSRLCEGNDFFGSGSQEFRNLKLGFGDQRSGRPSE